MSGWLLTDNAASWQGAPSDRGWRYLHQALKRYDNQSNDFRYAKASLETILSAGRSLSPPLWLIDIIEVGSQNTPPFQSQTYMSDSGTNQSI